MTKPAELIDYLFSEQRSEQSDELFRWMSASPRFSAFVATYRDKIRKKIRGARDIGAALDLQAELEVAFCLLADRRLELAYEPYASAKRRGPDFTVTYRSNLTFNLEVARLREDTRSADRIATHPIEVRILRILLAKLGQLQAGMGNLLVLQAPEELAVGVDLTLLMHAVKTRVEGNDPSFLATSRYSGPAAFFKDFLRLSGILVWARGGQLWINRQARPVLPEKVLQRVSSLANCPIAGVDPPDSHVPGQGGP